MHMKSIGLDKSGYQVNVFMPLHRMMPGAGFPSYVRDPVRLGLRHLYQVEFCSFIVTYPTVGGIRVLWTYF